MPPRACWPRPGIKAAYRPKTVPVPAVVLADSSACREFDVLQAQLEALNVPVVRLRRPDHRAVVAPVTGGDGALLIDGQRIRPIVTWVRHGTTAAVYAQLIRGSGAELAGRQRGQGATAADHDTGLLGAECWSRLLEAISAAAMTALPGGNPRLITQLVDASRHGVRVPRTFVTTDAAAAAARLPGTRVIAKIPDSRPLTPGSTPTSPEHTGPVVLQEYIEHSRELRVYYTDGGLTAFDVRKPRPDSIWTEPESVTVTVTTCPPRLADVVRRLATAWGLHYGAFDFLITGSGEPLFLEVNADGDWLWFERRARWQGVSFLVAAMTSELYVRHRRSEAVVR